MTNKDLLLRLLLVIKEKFHCCSVECDQLLATKDLAEYNIQVAKLQTYGDIISLLSDYYIQEDLGLLNK